MAEWEFGKSGQKWRDAPGDAVLSHNTLACNTSTFHERKQTFSLPAER
jgi:hypothetical protein